MRRNHQSHAARSRKPELGSDPMVIAWVKQQRAAGLNRDQVLAASKAEANGWPRPGASLSKGTLSPIWRDVAVPSTTSRRVRRDRHLDQAARMEKLAAEMRVKSKALTELQEFNRLSGDLAVRLINLNLAELNGLRDKMVERFLDSAFVGLVDLLEILSLRVGEFQARASEQAIRAKIAVMRNPAGRTGPEYANSCAIADRLERGLGDGMKLAGGD